MDAEVIKKIRYPEMDRVINLKPNPHIILGREIFFTEKFDGSNLGAYLDEKGELKLRSRNMDVASEQFHQYFKETEQCEGVIEMLNDASQWNDEYVIFGEFLMKGKSPAKFEFHDKHEFVVFDIWSQRHKNWFNYTGVYQHSYHFHLPVVGLWGTGKFVTLESLLEFIDKMLVTAKEKGREGVVLKAYGDDINSPVIFAKEKLDIPKIEKLPRVCEEGKVCLPELPESEITGAVEKVFADIGLEKFRDVRVAMPLVAQYVAEECRKHNCSNKKNLFSFYKDRLTEIELMTNE